MLKCLLMLAVAIATVLTDDLPPSCEKPIYCNSSLLHHVQMARVYLDSKHFVDMEMKTDEKTTLLAFEELLKDTKDQPTKDELEAFVNEYFQTANELEDWTPHDFVEEPEFLSKVRDRDIKEFAEKIVSIWPTLGRKVKQNVIENPEKYSLVPVTNGFIIPGGRFRELYYWDTYWIVKGLLLSDMKETAKGVIENLLELLKKFGHIPNGSRWYYQERSQPPLLTAMVSLYLHATNDIEFLNQHISTLEMEVDYWLKTHLISFDIEDKTFLLLRYQAPSAGPRPESYYEDYTNAQKFDTEERRQEFYTDIKSAAESGWDFSSRWFIGPEGDNGGNLINIHTHYIIPVDLNAIFANMLQNMAYFHSVLHNGRKAANYGYLAKEWRYNIEQVLWNKEDGVWYDYDILDGTHRKFFYPSNVAPLWMNAVNKGLVQRHAEKVINYLRVTKSLDYPGGIPTSLNDTGEQWDLPNAWPPLVSIVVNALEALDTKESRQAAFKVAQVWVRANRKGFLDKKQMFEKYDVFTPGGSGKGGEYIVQNGFGWSNGVIIEFIEKYADRLTAEDQWLSESSTSSSSISSTSSSSESS